MNELVRRGADVRALVRKKGDGSKMPLHVDTVEGDLLDPVSVEKALQGVDKLYLLNASSSR